MAKRFRQGQVLVTFTAGELRQMVVEPAERVGLRFDDGLVDRLLMDVQGDPGVLALLRFTLRRLWEARERNRITHEAYDRVGGGRLAVGRAAEQFFAPLSDDEKAAAQRLLLRLIQPATGTGVTCRRQPRDRLVPPAEAGGVSGGVLDKLVEAGLVVPVKSGDDAAPEYAPVHESLATAWPRFLKWLEDRRAEEQWRARLQAAAEEWQARGRKPETLWRGATLVLALQEAARLQAAGESLDPLEQTFLDASLARHRLRRVAQSAAIGAVGLGVLAFLGMWLWYEKSKNRILSDNLVLEEGLRTAETNLRRETALLNASWQGQEGARLAESGDTSGAFLWYARAWEQFDSVQDTVEEPDRSRLRANYLLQLGVAGRQAPALAGMAYAGMASDGFATVARTPDGSLALAARTDADAQADRPIARIWRWSQAGGAWSAPEDLPGLAGRGLTEMSGAYVSDDGHLVAVAATDRQGAGRVFVWDLPAPGAAVGPRESTFPGRFKEAALSPDGKHLAVVSSSCEAAKPGGGPRDQPARDPGTGPARGAREPTERVTVWRTDRLGEPLALPVPRDVGPLGGLTFSPRSDRLALGVGARPADGPEP
ncbi:MAG: hypothetical protein J2P46_21535, partial [Zavarzinella sp.]|nr:hypothetical protein [Zavarzinella sp.]